MKKIPATVTKTLDWFDGYPYRISVVYLVFLVLSFVPICLRVGNFLKSRWNPFPKFSDSQVLLLGNVCDVLMLLAAMTGVVMCVIPIVPLLFGRFKTAAKMLVGMLLALFLTAVIFFCMGPFVFCFSGETESIRAEARYRENIQ